MRIFTTLSIVATLLLAVAALARVGPPTIAVSDIRPGMKGYGLTVFRGVTPRRFDLEVIDVLHNFRPDQDLILVRTDHPVLDKAIVVAGMSGSPIFLEGKLAGAYAYGWTFGKEPVAGVTPIGDMLEELVRPIDPAIWKALGTLPRVASRAARPRRARLAGLPPYLGDGRRGAFADLRRYADLRGLGRRAPALHRLRPASTPIMLGGMHDAVAELLSQELERFSMVGLQAGGGQARGPAAGAQARFVEGGSIGVQLIRGDISATAIGTVTHVSGSRLVAFGHPMMSAGQTALPTSTAKVLHVLASERRSFKIAQAVSPLGTLVHDRQAGIVVDTELKADTVPVTVRLKGLEGAPRTEWNVEVASQRLLTPMLAFAAILNAVRVTVAERTDLIFEAHSRVRVEGHGTIETRDVGYSATGLASPMALAQIRLFNVLSAVYGNPFEDARVLGVEVELSVRFERDVTEIVDALVSSDEVDPGKDVNIYVTLRRFGHDEQVRIVPVHVPMSAAGEKLEILLEAGNRVNIEQPQPVDLDQILDGVRAGFPATSLVVSTKLPSRGLRLRGHVVHGLPGSALDTLQLDNDAGRTPAFFTHDRKPIDLGRVVHGRARIKLQVREEPLR